LKNVVALKRADVVADVMSTEMSSRRIRTEYDPDA
jgi:hypothetical protein